MASLFFKYVYSELWPQHGESGTNLTKIKKFDSKLVFFCCSQNRWRLRKIIIEEINDESIFGARISGLNSQRYLLEKPFIIWLQHQFLSGNDHYVISIKTIKNDINHKRYTLIMRIKCCYLILMCFFTTILLLKMCHNRYWGSLFMLMSQDQMD